MPLYDYICKACNSLSEIFHASTADKPACPKCHEGILEREYRSTRARPQREGVNRPGDHVKEFIEGAKEDLKEQSEKYKDRQL